MSIESDNDRLDIIQTLAGISTDEITVRHPGGSFIAIYDNASQDSPFDDVVIEGTAPVLTARTIDVADLVKDTPLQIGTDEYRFTKHEPDGTGMSRVILRL